MADLQHDRAQLLAGRRRERLGAASVQNSGVAAQGFLLELDAAVRAVAESPERWPVQPRGERRYVFPRYPFALLYRIRGEEVFVTAVAHHSRRPGYWCHRK